MKRPLVFYAVSTAMGCLAALEFIDNFIIGIAIAVLFFVIYVTTLEIKFFLLNALFFVLAAISLFNYFSLYPGKNIEIRILQNKDYYMIGNVKGRKVILSGNIQALEEGCKIDASGSFETDRDFSRGICGRYNIKNYKLLKKDFVYYSYEYKRYIYNKFKDMLGKDRTSVVMAVCYGDTKYIDSDKNMEFQKLGVVHAVSVSGFHMAIIYKAVEVMLGFKGAVLFSAVYAFFTGMSAATMRSFIMILVFKMSGAIFREYDSISSLSLSAVVLMMVKPYYIVDIGFGLSFLSTLGIILYYRSISKMLYMLPEKLSSCIGLDLSAQIYSMPYIAFTIQSFSYISIIGNLILLPLYSVIVVLGNAALLVSFVKPLFNLLSFCVNMVLTASEGAASLMLKLCSDVACLSYMEGIVILFSHMAYILYRAGCRKIKYLPALMLLGVFLESYSFLTEITFLNSTRGEAVILNSGFDKLMVCNYDTTYSSWVTDIRDSMEINRLVTNPRAKYNYFMDKSSFANISLQNNNSMNVNLYNDGRQLNFVLGTGKLDEIEAFKSRKSIYIPKYTSNKSSYRYENPLDKSITYVIIFNRAIRIR
ncbi:MAG: ComEC/Rec2 family competence protein [Clostridium sp.]|jgi:competence protein ComEC|uniref:ComEC/Rec2 family competence protein n=1 Tax=Clostridium sp. TaxID=1506 RepID=UPI0025BFBD5D|nr:ComEC/Rec2 family competence protein [Clostridium sp.]MCH3964706.1 ComEC/Rec2 family competence protein [Clostridium sp.]MCI1715177.1 ComEC/Rec2 family competence protein [Clostridium sp.]MCI1799439.1 ComEC/Rec2 family competence protein [Clostridium sp.]MCI1813360.1 ComEC/Rec2 family competence protein [Clostridium sp.]MCI1870251.1 ComEC/Rec2 family competence protein [Clostridium sp.]